MSDKDFFAVLLAIAITAGITYWVVMESTSEVKCYTGPDTRVQCYLTDKCYHMRYERSEDYIGWSKIRGRSSMSKGSARQYCNAHSE